MFRGFSSLSGKSVNIITVNSTDPPVSQINHLIFDGDCGICTRSAQLCQEMDKHHRFRILPFQYLNSEELARLGLARHECEGELKVVDHNGRVRGGAFAVNYFLYKHPPWGILVLIIYLLPILLLFEVILYRIVARNRTRISGWLGLSACKARRT
jgi:predicted DCC family thiol-disulfide oxidoreductase YuxK